MSRYSSTKKAIGHLLDDKNFIKKFYNDPKIKELIRQQNTTVPLIQKIKDNKGKAALLALIGGAIASQPIGYALGKRKEYTAEQLKKNYLNNKRQALKLLIPGGIGHEMGKYRVTSKSKNPETMKMFKAINKAYEAPDIAYDKIFKEYKKKYPREYYNKLFSMRKKTRMLDRGYEARAEEAARKAEKEMEEKIRKMR